MAKDLVTVQRFLEKAGVSTRAIGDTKAISDFIAARKLDPLILDLIPKQAVRRYVECLTTGERISYGDMLTAPAGALRGSADYSDLQTLALEISADAARYSVVVNFDIRKAYCGGNKSAVDDVCYARKTIPLTDELADELRGILAKAALPALQYEYPGKTDDGSGLVLALKKAGGLVRYAAYGRDSGFPEAAADACYAIMRRIYDA